MALIECPSCSKQISDKGKVCPHCDFAFAAATADDILRKKNFQHYQKMQALQSQTMLAMLVFLAGFGFMYWGGAQPGDLQHNLAIVGAVIGFIWYVVNRVRIILLKKTH